MTEAIDCLPTPNELAVRIDHTLLKPEATHEDVGRLCEEAQQDGFAAVCVNPIFVRAAAAHLTGSETVVCAVAGFPLGATPTANKVDEARRALDDGAVEVDMVIHVGALRAGQIDTVHDDVAAVAEVVHQRGAGHLVKVILECGALTDEQIVTACGLTARAGADFVKTSTGMHASGGATVEHVRLLRAHAGSMSVKAAGGIRTLDQSLAMIAAGADRLGTSSGTSIMSELKTRSGE